MVDFNFAYLGTKEGILKIIEIVLGGVSAGICFYYDYCGYFLSFILIFLVGSFILVLSIIFGAGMDAIYEGLYHFIGFAFIISGSILIISHNAHKSGYKVHDTLIAAGALGLVNSILYLVLGAVVIMLTGRYGVCEHLLAFADTFFIGTGLNLISIILGSNVDATYEKLYNIVAFAILLGGSVSVLVDYAEYSGFKRFDALLAAGGLGVAVAALHLVSFVVAYR